MATCPYCGIEAHNAEQEIIHMETQHPEILRQRMMDAGLLDWQGTRLHNVKEYWLSAMVYRTIADPVMDGVSRGILAATFTEEPPALIASIVDALIGVGVVFVSNDKLYPTPYEADDE